MSIIACDQFAVLGDACPCCGGWLYATIPGGISTGGLVVCSEECAAAEADRGERQAVSRHLEIRDWLCDCAEICAPRGLPSAADRDEAALWAQRGGVPWE